MSSLSREKNFSTFAISANSKDLRSRSTALTVVFRRNGRAPIQRRYHILESASALGSRRRRRVIAAASTCNLVAGKPPCYIYTMYAAIASSSSSEKIGGLPITRGVSGVESLTMARCTDAGEIPYIAAAARIEIGFVRVVVARRGR
ncbi:hypothetical protein HIM_11868 [Hirsutella minnesotensis 3608]|uniref:Uncharacterized protein n=1 Tax=Hirsutella minnesotensis 3608 TaxID=1043627 RepID=A0A0F7ZWC6_9HYPO|nr:hypothetical protein HIM_11868 [Hirsutella minnesotensis 3608]